MRKLLLEIFKIVNRFVYPILGASVSTKIATSEFGKMVFRFLYGNDKGLKIYNARGGIKLKLTQDEALMMGISHFGVINLYETNVLNNTIKNGHRTFYLSENTSSFYKQHFGKRQKGNIKVMTQTLDSYAKRKNIERIDFIKIDVECAEMDVVVGAKHILKAKNGPNLIIEVIDAQLKVGGSSKKLLLRYLKGLGYKVFAFGRRGLIKYDPRMHGSDSLNLFFTKRKEILDFVSR